MTAAIKQLEAWRVGNEHLPRRRCVTKFIYTGLTKLVCASHEGLTRPRERAASEMKSFMKKLLLLPLAVLAALAPTRAALVNVTDTLVNLAASANGTKNYTFTDAASGQSVTVAVTLTPFSPDPAAVLSLLDGDTRVGVGNPAVGGDGNRGGHAWFAYLMPSHQWNMGNGFHPFNEPRNLPGTGRYADGYANGHTRDPQTGRAIGEFEVQLTGDPKRRMKSHYEKAFRLRLAARKCDVAAVRAVRRSFDEHDLTVEGARLEALAAAVRPAGTRRGRRDEQRGDHGASRRVARRRVEWNPSKRRQVAWRQRVGDRRGKRRQRPGRIPAERGFDSVGEALRRRREKLEMGGTESGGEKGLKRLG